ncbi:UNVERIFIED_CONTAM: hypothetical protein FKN15_025072 [Acipenser sinensis]
MSGRLRHRQAANAAGKIEENVNERILSECHALYADPKHGLVKAAAALGLPLLAPRKKISIMLMGNHSAGKSSFINCQNSIFGQVRGWEAVLRGRMLQQRARHPTGDQRGATFPPSRCLNQIDGVCTTIEKTIDQSVQSSLNHLERDCDIIAESAERRLREDSYQATVNRKIWIKHFLFGCLGYLLPLCFLASFVIGCFSDDSLTDMAGPDIAHALCIYTVRLETRESLSANQNMLAIH